MDRRPLAASIASVAEHGADIAMATSDGLISFDPGFRQGQWLVRDPVTAVVWDGGTARWVAAGSRGLWREDLGWYWPIAADGSVPSGTFESMVSTDAGLLLTTPTELWLVRGAGAVRVEKDTGGLFGRPAALEGEIAVVGFWSIHRLHVSGETVSPWRDIPLPASLRADVPLGVAYLGRTLLVIGQTSGIYVLSPGDAQIPAAEPAPELDAAHREMGFPPGWVDYAVRDDALFLLSGAVNLYELSVAQPLRRVSRWPAPAWPHRFAALAGGGVLLYPDTGNAILVAEQPAARTLEKYNLINTSAGEILARRGLPPAQFAHESRSDRLRRAAVLTSAAAALIALIVWSILFGVPVLYRFHPGAGRFRERLEKFERDRNAFMQSLRRTNGEIARMRRKVSTGPAPDETSRKNFEDRIGSLSESRSSVIENLKDLAGRIADEARNIRTEGAHARSQPGAAPAGLIARLIASQTRRWEWRFLRLRRSIEQALKEESA